MFTILFEKDIKKEITDGISIPFISYVIKDKGYVTVDVMKTATLRKGKRHIPFSNNVKKTQEGLSIIVPRIDCNNYFKSNFYPLIEKNAFPGLLKPVELAFKDKLDLDVIVDLETKSDKTNLLISYSTDTGMITKKYKAYYTPLFGNKTFVILEE